MYSVLLSMMMTAPAGDPVPQAMVGAGCVGQRGAGCVGQKNLPLGPPEYFITTPRASNGCQGYALAMQKAFGYRAGCNGFEATIAAASRGFFPVRNAVARHNQRVADRSEARAERKSARSGEIYRVSTVSVVPVQLQRAAPPAAYFKQKEPVIRFSQTPTYRATPVRTLLCPGGCCPVN